MKSWKVVALVLTGVLAGALFANPDTSSAVAPEQFKECAWYCGFGLARRDPGRIENKAQAMPVGWSAVAGAGTEGGLCVLLCR
jgi:hypothetical protein